MRGMIVQTNVFFFFCSCISEKAGIYSSSVTKLGSHCGWLPDHLGLMWPRENNGVFKDLGNLGKVLDLT